MRTSSTYVSIRSWLLCDCETNTSNMCICVYDVLRSMYVRTGTSLDSC